MRKLAEQCGGEILLNQKLEVWRVDGVRYNLVSVYKEDDVVCIDVERAEDG